jgi:mono/diheme cytochrome c family protein
MFNLTSLAIYVVALVLLFLLRNRMGLLWSSLGFLAVTWLYLAMGFDPGVPASVQLMYIATTVIALLLYVSASQANREAFFGPITRMIVEPSLQKVRIAFLILVPALIAWQAHHAAIPSEVAPPKIRSAHPSPPSSIKGQGLGDVEGYELDVINGANPLREAQHSNPEKFQEYLTRGKTVYYQNCYYCHGDNMAADGNFASAVKPPPADFTDPGTIAMLTETFLFWRIAKGGPGLPNAGTPWDSSMPVWEDMLSVDDMWKVILYMYEHTGYEPRANEGGH